MPESDQIIDHYHEQNWAMSNLHYELYADRLRIHGRGYGEQFDVIIELKDLRLHQNRLIVPNRRMNNVFVVLSALLFSALFFLLEDLFEPTAILALILFALLCLLLYRLLPQGVEYVYFKWDHLPHESAFAIGRAGPDVERFDEFISQLNVQIRIAQSENDAFSTADPASPE